MLYELNIATKSLFFSYFQTNIKLINLEIMTEWNLLAVMFCHEKIKCLIQKYSFIKLILSLSFQLLKILIKSLFCTW